MAAIATMSMAANAQEVVTLDFAKLSEMTITPAIVVPTEASTGTDCSNTVFHKGGVSVSSTAGTSNEARIWKLTSGDTQYRIYKGAKMTISAEDNITKIVINGGNGNLTPTNATVTPGSFTAVAKVATWVGNTTDIEFTIGDQANIQINSIEVTIGGEIITPPTPAEPSTYELATTLESGSYVFVINEDGANKLGSPVNASYSYGRINLSDATVTDNKVSTMPENAFEITVADGKATIKDSYDRYYGMDDSHFTSFQCYTEINEGCYWTYAFEGNNVKFTNVLNPDCIVCQSKGNQGTWYTNVAPAKAPAEFNLPMIFKASTEDAGINDITVDNNAPVVYYNLQGVQVANPSNGIYIRRQGNKSTKVLVK